MLAEIIDPGDDLQAENEAGPELCCELIRERPTQLPDPGVWVDLAGLGLEGKVVRSATNYDRGVTVSDGSKNSLACDLSTSSSSSMRPSIGRQP